MLELRLPSISGSSLSKCAHLPDVLAVYEREDCDVDHIPAVLVVVLHLVQGQGYHRVTVVAAEVVLDKDIVLRDSATQVMTWRERRKLVFNPFTASKTATS